jgi:Predicted Ser/Thr protein kinase
MAGWPLSSPQAAAAFCYPRAYRCDPLRVAAEAESAGVCCIINMGVAEINVGDVRIRVLGKGHASLVVAGLTFDGQVVAIKVRRTDSKRSSLEGEGRLLEVASRAGASPAPLYYSKDLIVMEYVGDVSLEQVLRASPSPLLRRSLLEAVRAARALDAVKILHAELHRPLRNVFYPRWPSSLKAVIIDLESSSRECGNVNKVLSFMIAKGLLRGQAVEALRSLLRDYRLAGCPRDLYVVIEEKLDQAFAT